MSTICNIKTWSNIASTWNFKNTYKNNVILQKLITRTRNSFKTRTSCFYMFFAKSAKVVKWGTDVPADVSGGPEGLKTRAEIKPNILYLKLKWCGHFALYVILLLVSQNDAIVARPTLLAKCFPNGRLYGTRIQTYRFNSSLQNKNAASIE